MAKRRKSTEIVPMLEPDYGGLLTGISDLLDQARRMSARTVNRILTATYWEIGRRIVEHEQGGEARAEYGQNLLVSAGQGSDGQTRPRLFQVQPISDAGLLPRLGDIPDTVWNIRGQGHLPDTVGRISHCRNFADTVGGIRRGDCQTAARNTAVSVCRIEFHGPFWRFPAVLVALRSLAVGR